MYKEAQISKERKWPSLKRKKASLQLTKKKKKKPAGKEVATAVSEIDIVQSPLPEGVIGGLQ